MKRFLELLAEAVDTAARLRREPGGLTLRSVLAHARARLERAANPPLPEALANPDGKILESEIGTLEGLLKEIDELSASLPADAKPMGLAARSLVERSLEECRKPVVNARRLAEDMQQVSALATAMRERLLLRPHVRNTLPN